MVGGRDAHQFGEVQTEEKHILWEKIVAHSLPRCKIQYSIFDHCLDMTVFFRVSKDELCPSTTG